LAAVILGVLLAFYAPLIPHAIRATCSDISDPCLPNGQYTVYSSVTANLHYWGATYSSYFGYYFGVYVLGPYNYLIGTTGYTTSFIIPSLAIILLSTCALVVLISPEIVDGTDLMSTCLFSRNITRKLERDFRRVRVAQIRMSWLAIMGLH